MTDMTNFAPAFMGLRIPSVWQQSNLALIALAWNADWRSHNRSVWFFGGLPTLKTKGYYLSLVTMAIQIALPS